MRVWFTGVDQGDGSIGVSFHDSREAIELLEEHDFEGHRGEGGGSFEVPDGTEIKGIKIQTVEDAKQYLLEMGFLEENND